MGGGPCNSQLNTSLSEIGQSPIKLHSMPSCSQCHYGKYKLSLIINKLKRATIALKVSLQEVTSKNTLIEYESKKKAEDFDISMEKINKPGTTHSRKNTVIGTYSRVMVSKCHCKLLSGY